MFGGALSPPYAASALLAFGVSLLLVAGALSQSSAARWRASRPGEPRRMKVFGHRGASSRAPENTEASLREALGKVNADGAEFDLQFTRDGELVLLHDDKLRRCSADAAPPGMSEEAYDRLQDTHINELSLREAQSVDIGSWKAAAYGGERLITFGRALDLLDEYVGKTYFAEVKGGDHKCVELLQQAMARRSVRPEQLVFIGFDLAVMEKLKAALPRYRCLLISGEGSGQGTRGQELMLARARAARRAGLDGIDYQADPALVDEGLVRQVKAMDLCVAVWVTKRLPACDAVGNWVHMERAGVDIFTSDLPMGSEAYIWG